tara:strand:+ start:1314 stop:1751 length:438 start_codon:yes stop_codon:yes gene_type:complete
MDKSLFIIALLTSFVAAENFEVKMVNADASGQVMVFEPPFIRANIGDTVTFLPTDMLHNSQSVPGLIPSSASSWNGGMNEKITIELNVEGVYVYQCTPHIALGMIGVIQVGSPTNFNDVKKSISSLESMIVMNKERVQQYLSKVD